MVLQYVKSTVEILLNLKFEDSDLSAPKGSRKFSSTSKDAISEVNPVYEKMLQKVENEVRHHISVTGMIPPG